MAIVSRMVATLQIAHFSRVYAAYGGVFVAMPPAVQPASSAPAQLAFALLKIGRRQLATRSQHESQWLCNLDG